MSLSLITILILCGILTNLMSAILGIGGGVLMVPILYTLFPSFPLQMISAISLTIVVGSSLINSIYFYQQKIPLNIKAIFLWSLSMIIGVQLGFEASFYLPDRMIIIVFTSTLIGLAFKTFFTHPLSTQKIAFSNEYSKGCKLCLFGGVIAGMTGIGGGSIMAPLIGQLKTVKPEQIAPYTNYMMVLGGVGNLYAYLSKTPPIQIDYMWQVGYINFSIVAIVVSSAFVTSFLSMKIRGILTPILTKKLLSIILLLIASYMFIAHFIK